MISKAHQRLLPLLLVLIVAGGVLVYAPASTILLGTSAPCWAFFLAIVLLLGNGRSRHY